jgi:hypothetical protein
MALGSLMPEPHSKPILWYRCCALCSIPLGMALSTMDAGDWLVHFTASIDPDNKFPYEPRSALFVLLDSSGTFGCLIAPLQYALFSCLNLSLSKTCYTEEWLFGRRISMTILGTLPKGHLRVSPSPTLDHRRTRKLLEVDINDRSESNYFPSSQPSHQYTPRGRRPTNQAVR